MLFNAYACPGYVCIFLCEKCVHVCEREEVFFNIYLSDLFLFINDGVIANYADDSSAIGSNMRSVMAGKGLQNIIKICIKKFSEEKA